jgi:hypothetical protein
MEIAELFKMMKEQEISDQEAFFGLLYSPDPRLRDELEKLKLARDLGLSDQEKGKQMERVAGLVLRGAKWLERPRSFQSATAQYDLICSVDVVVGGFFAMALGLQTGFSSFIVEAKAESKPVANTDFLRLCSLVGTGSEVVRLGIFFTICGGSGFPKPGGRAQKGLQDSRLSQLLFYYGNRRYVLVFDIADLEQLERPGSFVRFLKQKMEAVREGYGYYADPALVSIGVDSELPKHLHDIWD